MLLLGCERHTELVGLCQVACAELCQVAVPAGIHVQRVAPFCPLLLALPRTRYCKQAAGQAPAAAWCCRTMLALAWRSRRRRCSWHNCACRSSLTRAHVRVCAGCKWRALVGYAAWDPTAPPFFGHLFWREHCGSQLDFIYCQRGPCGFYLLQRQIRSCVDLRFAPCSDK